MTAPLQLRTFGDLLLERVHEDGSTETLYRAGKLLALLLHLSTQGGTPQRRAELADLFWGDEAPEKARASLRQAIASLHRLLGESALIATRETLQLVPGAVVTDHERFLVAVRSRDGDAVMRLYRGPFLATEPRMGAEFERWVAAERRRLQRSYLEVMERAVSEALQEGEVMRATELARAVRTAEPQEAGGVRLLFDALGAGGRRSDARRVIEAFADQIGQSEETLPTELVQRLDRARGDGGRTSGEVERPFDAAALGGLGSVLVGRDDLLTDLIAAAERSRLGSPRTIVLVGVSGSGKSRVLDEFESRVQLRGARTVRIRLLPTMRAVPFAALAELVRALAVQPGALGVSASSAATLVAFLPELLREFPAAEASPTVEADTVRRRQEALLDLVAAVAERRAVSVLVDDGQHADPETLAVLRAVPRLREGRLMLLLAAWTPVLDGTDGVEVFDLPPLSADAVHAMLEGEAAWTAAPWEAPFIERLTVVTGGVPQVIIQVVRALLDEGYLRVDGGAWVTDDPDRLVAWMGEARTFAVDLGSVSELGRLLLRILSVWGRPLSDRAVRGIARTFSIDASDEGCGAFLEVLEARGLITSRAGAWGIAHDSIAEALRAAGEERERAAIRGAAVRWSAARPDVDLPTIEHLILLCAEGDDLSLACAAISTLTRDPRWRRAQRLSARLLASRLAVAAGRPEWTEALFGAMGWVARRSRLELAWYSIAGSLGFSVLLLALYLFWPRLRVEVEPLGEAYPFQRLATMQVQPRVGVYNALGQRLRLRGKVRVEAQEGSRLIGDTIIDLEDGRAQFTRLGLVDFVVDSTVRGASPVPQRLTFRASGLILRSSSVVHGLIGSDAEGIRVIRATINGRALDSTLTVRVPVGTPLRVELTYSYTTPGATSNYVVGAGPTWLDPQTSVIRLAGLPRPVIDAWQTVEFDVPASPRDGHHHLLILFRGEDSVDHLFSATNWTVGPPVWGDGNDLVTSLTESQIQTLRREGVVRFARYLTREYPTQQAQAPFGGRRIQRVYERYAGQPTILQGTAIEIDFVAPDR